MNELGKKRNDYENINYLKKILLVQDMRFQPNYHPLIIQIIL